MSIPKKISLKRVFELVFVCVIVACLLTAALVKSGYVGDLTEQWYTPSQEASYIIGQYNSTFYYLQNHTGFGYEAYDGYEYESSNASAVFQEAREGLGTLANGAPGTIQVKYATYNLDSPIIIGHLTHLIGEASTVLSMTANANAIEISIDTDGVEGCDWTIKNFEIRMNSLNGNGIYSSNASRKDGKMSTPRIENVRVWNVSAHYAGIKLSNFFASVISGGSIYTSGYGIQLILDNNLLAGNSLIQQVEIYPSASGTIGFYVEASPGKYYNLMVIDRMQVGGGDNIYTNTTGVFLNGTKWCVFNGLNLEGNAVNLYMNNSRSNTFNNMFADSNKTSTDGFTPDDGILRSGNVVLEGSSINNQFIGGWFDCGATQYVFNDTSTSSSGRDWNLLVGTMLRSENFTFLSRTKCHDVQIYSGALSDTRVTSYGTQTTVINGQDIAHYLITTPTHIDITQQTIVFESVTVIVGWDVAASNSTHWRVRAYFTNGTAVVDSGIAIYWVASVYER